MKTPCSEGETCCSAAASTECGGAAKCHAESGGNCPIEEATHLWAEAFGDAMRQAQTELLKAKILKSWGPMMDQEADAMIETMGALWLERIAEVRAAEAKGAFAQRLRDLWLKEKKK